MEIIIAVSAIAMLITGFAVLFLTHSSAVKEAEKTSEK